MPRRPSDEPVTVVTYDELDDTYRSRIRAALRADRPDRYKTTDKDWKNRAIAVGRQNYPNDTSAITKQVERDVNQIEGQENKLGNKIFYGWGSGEVELDWDEVKRLPISISKYEKVRYDVVTPEDFRTADRFQKGEAHKAYDAVKVRCDAYLALAKLATDQGHAFVRLVGNQPKTEGPRLIRLVRVGNRHRPSPPPPPTPRRNNNGNGRRVRRATSGRS
jgi:hypothetical protein